MYCRAGDIDPAALAPLLQESVVSSAAAAHEATLPTPEVLPLPVLRIEDGAGGVHDCIIQIEVLALGAEEPART